MLSSTLSHRPELVGVGSLVVDALRTSGTLPLNAVWGNHGRLHGCLPLVANFGCTPDKRSLNVGSEEISVMILSVGVSRINDGYFLGCSRVWLGGRVASALEVPGIRNHQVEIRVIFYVA